MNDYPKTIIITEKTGLFDILQQLMDIYDFNTTFETTKHRFILDLKVDK